MRDRYIPFVNTTGESILGVYFWRESKRNKWRGVVEGTQ